MRTREKTTVDQKFRPVFRKNMNGGIADLTKLLEAEDDFKKGYQQEIFTKNSN